MICIPRTSSVLAAFTFVTLGATSCEWVTLDPDEDADILGTWTYTDETRDLQSGFLACTTEGTMTFTAAQYNEGTMVANFNGRIACERDVRGPVWHPLTDRVAYSLENGRLWFFFQGGSHCEGTGTVVEGESRIVGSLNRYTLGYCGQPGSFRMTR